VRFLCSHEHSTNGSCVGDGVLLKRHFSQIEWCQAAPRNPVRRDVKPEGRINRWAFIPELDNH